MQTKDILYIVVALITIVTASYGATEFFAKKAEVQMVAMRLDNKILEDQATAIQQRLWALEDRYGCPNCSGDPKNEYRKLQEQLRALRQKLDVIYKQMKGGG